MTKTELVKKLAGDCELTLKDAEAVVNIFIGCVIQALASGDKVELRGFGSFRTKRREARRGRNPKTGKAVRVPAKTVPFFKPGKEFRTLVDPQPEPAMVGHTVKRRGSGSEPARTGSRTRGRPSG
jgi:integration host factor subunit beta